MNFALARSVSTPTQLPSRLHAAQRQSLVNHQALSYLFAEVVSFHEHVDDEA